MYSNYDQYRLIKLSGIIFVILLAVYLLPWNDFIYYTNKQINIYF